MNEECDRRKNGLDVLLFYPSQIESAPSSRLTAERSLSPLLVLSLLIAEWPPMAGLITHRGPSLISNYHCVCQTITD